MFNAKRAVILMAFLVSGCFSTDPNKVMPPAKPTPPVAPVDEVSFDKALTKARRAAGVGVLTENKALERSATGHAKDMERKEYLAHVNPAGLNFDKRMLRAGYCIASMAENIAEGPKTEAAVFKMWMDSPAHRKNMLNGKYTQYGLARSGRYWVLDLAGPCVRN
ncbi:CAP domain-containing protein [Thalassobius vesicularis]|uniref:CAP domain-containing protein n=1 Tax=Thalassobius vesicularis TaxID=1294297 RepID=A0A4S3ME86_9RHOB|nr:CAP domain-containing protein [Thalassobius vesicularis]THD75838.1 CAP domain-containing protein [Thalassobius vesicularis]